MTSAQLEMAVQAIAKEHGCDLDGNSGICPAGDKGEPCLCERFARVALRAAEEAALCETP
jgi:hypothetical protein